MSSFGRSGSFKYKQGATDSISDLPYTARVVNLHPNQSQDTIEMSSYSKTAHSNSSPNPGHSPRTGSLGDLFQGVRQFENDIDHFNSSDAQETHLAFAEGDIPNNRLAKIYHYLLNVSILTRWILFIIPVMGIIWIPAILQFTSIPNGKVLGVKLLFWSIWLSIVWGGWWGALAVSRLLPSLIRHTVGVVAVATRRYIDWLSVLHRYVAFSGWTAACFASFQPLINAQQVDGTSQKARDIVSIFAKLLFALFLCAQLLLFEKFAIQWIAAKFHERSYADRIADQKFAVRALVVLYRHSHDVDRDDTFTAEQVVKEIVDPRKLFKRVFKGARNIAQTTTTALGNVASEIAGTSVLQPNSPAAMVQTALESANKSRLLARRLFYSFAKPGSEYLYIKDISRFFPDQDTADRVYALFDRDGNGDASREEVEIACTDLHREQLSLERSMQDLDSAVGRLDNILMSVYVIVAALITAVVLEAAVATLITGAGTLILGLSWLIGSSLSEVLISIIFLFVKHPFDVGDRVDIGEDSYTVKEIRLLSTIFLDGRGVVVQAPNVVLNEKFILNIRRSSQFSEPFTFDVMYETSFKDLERLRDKMIDFLQAERRDFFPVFDVSVVDYPNQESMTLTADIKYKSNSQQGGLKARRRNKWLCALKQSLAECEIYGPSGNPKATPAPKRITNVPWTLVEAEDKKKDSSTERVTSATSADFHLRDKNTAIIGDSDDVFGDTDELRMTNPRRGLSNMGPSNAEPSQRRIRAHEAAGVPPQAAFIAVQEMQQHSTHDLSRHPDNNV